MNLEGYIWWGGTHYPAEEFKKMLFSEEDSDREGDENLPPEKII